MRVGHELLGWSCWHRSAYVVRRSVVESASVVPVPCVHWRVNAATGFLHHSSTASQVPVSESGSRAPVCVCRT